MPTPEDAKGVLQSLEDKLADARTRRDEAQSSAKGVAFAAHTGDAEARKQLAKFEADAGKLAIEIGGLEAAVVEAKRRVNEAVAADVYEAEREKAQQALALLDDFGKRGDELDSALAKFVSKYVELTKDFRALERLGYAPTSFALVQINMKAATATKLMFTDIQQEFLAPHARRDFRTTIESWANHIRARASARLSKNAPAKAA